jgi:hypothetical protein
MYMKYFYAVAFCLSLSLSVSAQEDSTDLLAQLEKEVKEDTKNATTYTTATFKTTRLINGHSVENVGKGVLDVKISHRFGTLNKGGYELFGLDNATMRMGLDYGITQNLMVGFGRSTFQKAYDAFLKFRILRQSTGKQKMPVTVSYVPTIIVQTLRSADPERDIKFRNRLSFTHQLIIGRKFSNALSLQLMPTFVHMNLVPLNRDPNNIFAIGIGGRQKLTKRVSLNAEYYYQIPGAKLEGSNNVLSLGFDIETGGHVFQLHFTNSQGMNEQAFVTQTKGRWDKGDILFGFNISRVFTIGKR